MSRATGTQDRVTREFVDAKRLGVLIRTPLENVSHFQAEHKGVTVFTKSNGEFSLNIPLWLIERILHGHAISTHRSYLVMNHALKGSKMFKPTGAANWEIEVMATVHFGGRVGMQPHAIRIARRENKRVREQWRKANA